MEKQNLSHFENKGGVVFYVCNIYGKYVAFLHKVFLSWERYEWNCS